MTPPEPEPVPEYTYSTSESVTLNSSTGLTGTLYKEIRYNGTNCYLNTTDEDQDAQAYPNLILYEVDGTKYAYFARGTTVKYGILANNSGIGLTIPTYRIYNGAVTQGASEYVKNSTPSDYYENIKSGNFTLVQRS